MTAAFPRDRDGLAAYSRELLRLATQNSFDAMDGRPTKDVDQLVSAALGAWAARYAKADLAGAMRVFRGLEDQERHSVSREVLLDGLRAWLAQVPGFPPDQGDDANRVAAEALVRTMLREGLVYESKPGWLRRLGA